MKQVLLDGFDILNAGLIKELPSCSEEKSYGQDLISIPDYNFNAWNGKDTGYFWSPNAKTSFFHGRNIHNSVLKVLDNNIPIWIGNINKIDRDYTSMSAQVSAISVFNKVLNQNVEYYNTNITPAEAVKEMLLLYDLDDYIGISFEWSKNFLESLGFLVRISFRKEDNITLYNAIQTLADISCSDCFTTKGKIEFRTFDSDLTNIIPNYTIGEDVISNLKISNMEDSIINDYSIKYGTGDTIKDSLAGDVGQYSRSIYGTKELKSIDISNSSNVNLNSLEGAIWLGDSYIKRSGNPILRIEFELDREEFGKFIDLNTYFIFSGSPEDLSNLVFEVMKLEYKDDLIINITADAVKSI